jgi:hypothetical protein
MQTGKIFPYFCLYILLVYELETEQKRKHGGEYNHRKGA